MNLHPQEVAYWLHLAFGPDRGTRREINGLVLTANRREGLGLLELLRLDPADLPQSLQPHARTLARLQAAEGRIGAQAFAAAELERRRIRLLPITHPRYPAHLAQRLTPGAAPTVLLVAGEVELLAAPGVAVSGSRDAGPQGLAFARAIAATLAELEFPVVSGLARGVDTEALEGALTMGGSVIGIAPEGLLASRWVRDRRLADRRLVVISEFPPQQSWQAGAAMTRNRTIAGMSRALIVADCVAEGGTTHQVDIHRKLGLTVYVRRGEGEGAKIADLAALPGVRDIRWEAGAVTLPEDLHHPASQRAFAEPPSLFDEPSQASSIENTPSIPQVPSPSAELSAAPSSSDASPPDTPPQTRSEANTMETAPSVPTSARDLILAALGPGPCSLDELSIATALSEGKLRRHLDELVQTARIVRFKRGRRYCYSRSTEGRPEEHGPLFAR